MASDLMGCCLGASLRRTSTFWLSGAFCLSVLCAQDSVSTACTGVPDALTCEA